MVEKRTPGQRLIDGATEALAIAIGEQPAAAIWIDGHQYVPAEEIQRLRAEVERLTSQDAAERLAYVGLRSFNGHSMHVDSAVRYMKWELDAIRAEASKKGGEG